MANKYRKLSLLSAILICMSVIFTISVSAITVHSDDTFSVIDNANLLSDENITSLNAEASLLSITTGFDIVLLTTAETNGNPSKEFADNFYDDNVYGDDGVLFLIDMDNREAYISTSGAARKYFEGQNLEETLDGMVSFLQNEDYYGCLSYSIQQLNTYYNNETFATDDNTNYTDGEYSSDHSEIETSRFSMSSFLFVGITGSIITVIVCLTSVISGYKLQKGAPAYALEHYGKLDLQENSDTLVNRTVTVRKIPKPQSNNNSSNRSSGGSSHGGGGKKF